MWHVEGEERYLKYSIRYLKYFLRYLVMHLNC
nr:MAG TPA: hypothetical protein [Caudoviricetes sp.]